MSTLFQIKQSHISIINYYKHKHTHFSRHTWLKVDSISCKIVYVIVSVFFKNMRKKDAPPSTLRVLHQLKPQLGTFKVCDGKKYEMYLCVAPLKWLLAFDSDDCGTSHEKYCFYFGQRIDENHQKCIWPIIS